MSEEMIALLRRKAELEAQKVRLLKEADRMETMICNLQIEINFLSQREEMERNNG